MKKEKYQCQYGSYAMPSISKPDKNLFQLRIKALLLNDDFKNYCSVPGIDDLQMDILSAWGDFPAWYGKYKDDYCAMCLLFYGNIFQQNIETTWAKVKLSIANMATVTYSDLVPMMELKPEKPAPAGYRSVSFDPSLRHKDLVSLFQNLISKMEKPKKNPADAIRYFKIHPKAKIDEAVRSVTAATVAQELKEKHPKTWMKKMASLYDEYSGNADSKRKIIYLDMKRGRNISYWALRGIFPKTSNPK